MAYKLKKAIRKEELPISKLKYICDESFLDFKTTAEIKLRPEIIGQTRAINALRVGLDIDSSGYNIFVTGEIGTGRKTTVKRLIKESPRTKNISKDKCYVNNFKNPDEPILISFSAGEGRVFKKEMHGLIQYLVKSIPAVFESKEYDKKKKEIIEEYKKKEKEVGEIFEKEAESAGFTIMQVQTGQYVRPSLVPLIDGKPADVQKLKLEGKKDKIKKIEEDYTRLNGRLEATLKSIRKIEISLEDRMRQLELEHVLPIIEHRIEEIKAQHKNEKLNKYLDDIKVDIIDNIGKFLEQKKSEEEDTFRRYYVNLVVDNYGKKCAPVIFETSPTYRNLFGGIESRLNAYGEWGADFMDVKAGSILKAEGGFLIIDAMDTLIEPGVWTNLKRILRNRKLDVQNYNPSYMFSVSGLKPEAVDIDVKVVMVGPFHLYNLLYEYDEDFKKIFKIRADFDSSMEVRKDTIKEYANFIKKIVEKEQLLNFDRAACLQIIEYGMRLARKQDKLSTQFHHIADLLCEANYWTKRDNKTLITEDYVKKAVYQKFERSRLIEEKIEEMLADGTIMIDISGSVIGQVNGLSVYDAGDYAFGKPARITAKVGVGDAGIINIEREAELSGKIHNKGVLILSGYLRGKYAQDKPLILSASLCFEQSYGGVEGDSASSTELYALISALSGLPLRQDIAVTGSVNQKGEIQAIGGVTEKVEGFYGICKIRGFTGKQGVMIPHQNVKDLMLLDEVVKAVKQGKFHIYAIKSIDEGVEVLTGIKAGDLEKTGSYEKGTINWLVSERLEDFIQKWRSFSGGNEKKKKKRKK
ncbi:MAG: ATP-binding protein [bacterium]